MDLVASCRSQSCADFFDREACLAFGGDKCAFRELDNGNFCWSGETATPPCNVLSSRECPGLGKDRCRHVEALRLCLDQDVTLTCADAFGAEELCLGLGCDYFAPGFICHDKGSPFACSQLFLEDACAAVPGHRCTYSDMGCRDCPDPDGCKPPATTLPPVDATACDTLTNETCGDSPKCLLLPDGLCRDRTCNEVVHNHAVCAHLKCVHHESTGYCTLPDDDRSCAGYLTWDDCRRAPTRCLTDVDRQSGERFCRDITCADLPEDECKESELKCRYSTDGRFCTVADGPDLCDRIVDEAPCKRSSDCKWHAQGQLCGNVGEEVQCTRYPSQEACESDGQRCRFDEAAAQCLNKVRVAPRPCPLTAADAEARSRPLPALREAALVSRSAPSLAPEGAGLVCDPAFDTSN